MNDNTRMNPGDGGDLIATDALDTLNGQPADTGLKVQRVKVGFGPDGGLQDVDAAHPMPVAGPLTNAELRAAAVPVSGPLTDAQLRAAAVPVSMAAAPLPSGAATAALQTTGNTALANLDADVGALADAAAGADGTGNYSLISAAKRALLNWATLLARVPALVNGRVPVDGSGVTQPVSGPLTNAQLRAADVPVSGPLTDAQLRAALLAVEPLGTPTVSRTLAVTATTASVALTATCKRVSIRARGCDMRYVVGTGAQTADASTSHFIGQDERLDIAVPASATIAAIREIAATVNGSLAITELG